MLTYLPIFPKTSNSAGKRSCFFQGKMGRRNSPRKNNQNNGSEIQRAIRPNKAKFEILMADLIVSFMWVCSSSIIDFIVYRVLGFGHNPVAEGIKCVLKVMNMFFFAVIGRITGEEGSYNPLTVLVDAISANFNRFLFTLGARIPAQVVGSILGVKLLIATFSDYGQGPNLNVEIHHGALTEGILAFIVAIVSMGLAQTLSGSFYMKNWIASTSKTTLQILCSDLTGACINPATAVGWAYARGNHMTKEHILVYWLAPIEATLVAVWVFKLLVEMGADKKEKKKIE